MRPGQLPLAILSAGASSDTKATSSGDGWVRELLLTRVMYKSQNAVFHGEHWPELVSAELGKYSRGFVYHHEARNDYGRALPWSEDRRLLNFPGEIEQVGYSIAGAGGRGDGARCEVKRDSSWVTSLFKSRQSCIMNSS